MVNPSEITYLDKGEGNGTKITNPSNSETEANGDGRNLPEGEREGEGEVTVAGNENGKNGDVVTDDVDMPSKMNTEERMEDGEMEQESSFNVSVDQQEDSMPPPTPKSENSSTIDSEDDDSSDAGEVPAKRRKTTGTTPTSDHYKAGITAIRHHQTLKKTREAFLQHKFCLDLKNGPTVGKCMECKFTRNPNPRKKGKDSICRFYSFRKLRYTMKGTVVVAGFPDVASDYLKEDLDTWMPVQPPAGMSLALAQYLLKEVGDQFCGLVKQEKATLNLLLEQESQDVIWRKTVKNLRELCDVCSTTLFNYHWTCGKCGFVVCLSCFTTRKTRPVQDENSNPSTSSESSAPRGDKDSDGWLLCHKSEHSLEQLLLTQIIAGNALDELSLKVHQLRKKLNISQRCGCDLSFLDDVTSAEPKESEKEPKLEGTELQTQEMQVKPEPETKVEVKAKPTKERDSDEEEDEDDQDGLMDLFGGGDSNGEDDDDEEKTGNQEVEKNVTNDKLPAEESSPSNTSFSTKAEPQLTNFVRKGGSSNYTIKVVPKRTLSAAESTRLYPNAPHTWLCRGNLLRLLEPTNPNNFEIFQEQWKRGQPVIVSNVSSKLNPELWTPESFSTDFGHKTNPLINCMTGKTVLSQRIKVFWDGFEHMKRRLQDENGRPMLLKLKDWPPGHDFAEISPNRFKDLMGALPLGEYTYREGMLNLAARLPEIFSRPDLGPKMYIAYGSGLHLDKGTTNLHLDVSDAVNVMVYVGGVKDVDDTAHTKAVLEAIEESDCDFATIKRVRNKEDFPGALWHIWEASDADKIRDLINKVSYDRGVKVERHHDAIHDQSWYLDKALRRRLMEEYNVIGYPIVQCAGDAVFIPAGAPHQVRNLNNCIKIAEDFVSPENVGHCFYLTEEFRNLSETHSNHEDKLQIKNIVYHTIKDAVAVIENSLRGGGGETC